MQPERGGGALLRVRGGTLGENPMKGFISFPHVMGHEVVGTVVEVGPAAGDLAPGERVVLNPWLTCAPRGIDPVCPACAAGWSGWALPSTR